MEPFSFSYSGTYEVLASDEETREATVRHVPEVASEEEWVGLPQIRIATLEAGDGRLVLRTREPKLILVSDWCSEFELIDIDLRF